MYYSNYCLVQSFSVENLKCFEQITIDLQNGTNIISGRGGTGKSALIEAFCLILCWDLYILDANFFSQIRRFNTDNTTIIAEISLEGLQKDFKDIWWSKLSPELIKIIEASADTNLSTIKLVIHLNNTFEYYINNIQLNYTQYYEWHHLINSINPVLKEAKKSKQFSIETFFSTEFNLEENYMFFIDQLNLIEPIVTYNNLDKQLNGILAEKDSFQARVLEYSQLESSLNSQIKILEEYTNLNNQLNLINQELLYAPLAALENRHEALKNSLKRITEDIAKTKLLLEEKELQQRKLKDEITNTENEKNSKKQDYESFRQQYLEKRAIQDRSLRKTTGIEKSLTNLQFNLRQTNMKISDTNRLLQELEKNKAIISETEFNQKKKSLLDEQTNLNRELEKLNEQYTVYKQEQKLKLTDVQVKDKKSTLLSDELQKKQEILEESTAKYEKLLEQHDHLHSEIEVLAEKIEAFEEERSENQKELEILVKNLNKETSNINKKDSPRPPAIRAQITLNNLKNNIENKISQLKEDGLNFDAYKQLQEYQVWKHNLADEEKTREQEYVLIKQKLEVWKQSWNKMLEHQKEQLQNILNSLLEPFKTKIYLNLTFTENPDKGYMKNSLTMNEYTLNPLYLSSSEQTILEYIIILAFAILTGKKLFLDDKLLQKVQLSDINTLLKTIHKQNDRKKDKAIEFPQIIFIYPYISIKDLKEADNFLETNIIELIQSET